jgi:hypothetical protein
MEFPLGVALLACGRGGELGERTGTLLLGCQFTSCCIAALRQRRNVIASRAPISVTYCLESLIEQFESLKK